MAEKKDVRVTKTQRSLVQALIALLENQSFAKITVNDICMEAMVSRSTFYAHFEDKYRLLHHGLQEMDRRIFAGAPDLGLRELLAVILGNMKKNEKSLRNLLTAEPDIELLEMFRQHFVSIFQERMEASGRGEDIPAVQMEIVASFYAAGVSQISALWITKRLPVETEEMADTLYALLERLRRPGTPLPRVEPSGHL